MIINRLPTILDQKGISIRELSRLTGITYTTIRALYHSERKSIQLSVLDAICATLEIQPGDIYQRLPDGSAYDELEAPAELKNPARNRERIVARSHADSWITWE